MMYDFKSAPAMEKRHEITDSTGYDLSKISRLEDLLKKAKNGDKIAVEEICKSFNGMIINLSRSIYINGYTMEDMIQEGRVSLIKAIGSYDINSKYPFTAYAKSAVKKNFHWKIRNNTRKPSCCSLYSCNSQGNELLDMIPSTEDIEEDFIKRQYNIKLWEAIEKLPEEKRDIIIWYHILEKDLKEYAAKKGIAYRTAVYKKKKALDILKEYLILEVES
ncbi:sigma-70 family RNA polymerase sigma factor [Clostridium sp. WILCCON 0269]|uniref:Sigma-70 family RNA polymerase sigma factor n=1 Tax=Candidatus Clostridium eludens TaxID=3381663 RepID=A0ABW8SGK1_9CLOT